LPEPKLKITGVELLVKNGSVCSEIYMFVNRHGLKRNEITR